MRRSCVTAVTGVLVLRKGVKWHDGQPFTSKDVKFTFDMVRGAPDAQGKLRLSPRKDWYANVEAIEVPDPHTVVFRLKRPQPSLLLMLASGYSPIYAAHVPPANYRTTPSPPTPPTRSRGPAATTGSAPTISGATSTRGSCTARASR
jgi:ABC-type transport system substrate-binding protein